MILLDDKTPSLMAMAAAQKDAGTVPPPLQDEFGQTIKATDSISQAVKDSLRNMDITDLKAVVTGENTIVKDGLHALTELTVQFVPKLLAAILVLWLGLKVANLLRRAIIKALDKRDAEPSLKSFLGSLTNLLLKAMVVFMAMDIIGIKATSFIALIGAMGLAIGMALQGTLQNFAGGVIILLLKPFKVDDYIECGQYKGYIKEIRIFHTIMRPFNGRTIIIPNSELATKSLINHTKEPQIRLDVVASVAYGTDLRKAKAVLQDVIAAEPLIRHDFKEPVIAVSELQPEKANSPMVVTLLGIVISVSEPQSWNVAFAMTVNPPFMTTAVRLLQFWNAILPRVVTLPGNVTSRTPLSLKTPIPIVVRRSPNVTFARAVHPLKA